MICPLHRSKLIVMGGKRLGNWSEFGASCVEWKEENLKSLLQSQSNNADYPLGARIYTLPQDSKSSVSKRFLTTLVTHSCSSAIRRRPNSSLCAFGHTTCIPCHNPSARSLPAFSLPAPSHLTKLLPTSIHPLPWDPGLLRSRSVRSELTLGKPREF